MITTEDIKRVTYGSCFKHDRITQHATLRDGVGNFLLYQTSDVCVKCGKVFSQELGEWDSESGTWERLYV